jgi:hypothetical protein
VPPTFTLSRGNLVSLKPERTLAMTASTLQHPQEVPANRASELTRILNSSSYGAIRRVVISSHEGVLTLRGVVPTFHIRQVALALVMEACKAKDIIVNDQIQVVTKE